MNTKIDLSTPLPDLPLTVRALKCLKSLGVSTLEDIVRLYPKDILYTRNAGKKTLEELTALLTQHCLHLGMTEVEISVYSGILFSDGQEDIQAPLGGEYRGMLWDAILRIGLAGELGAPDGTPGRQPPMKGFGDPEIVTLAIQAIRAYESALKYVNNILHHISNKQ